MKNRVGENNKTSLLFEISSEYAAKVLIEEILTKTITEIEGTEHLKLLGYLRNAIEASLLQEDSHFVQHLKNKSIIEKNAEINENIQLLSQNLQIMQAYINFEIKENKISNEISHKCVFQALDIIKTQEKLELNALSFHEFNKTYPHDSSQNRKLYEKPSELESTSVKSSLQIRNEPLQTSYAKAQRKMPTISIQFNTRSTESNQTNAVVIGNIQLQKSETEFQETVQISHQQHTKSLYEIDQNELTAKIKITKNNLTLAEKYEQQTRDFTKQEHSKKEIASIVNTINDTIQALNKQFKQVKSNNNIVINTLQDSLVCTLSKENVSEASKKVLTNIDNFKQAIDKHTEENKPGVFKRWLNKVFGWYKTECNQYNELCEISKLAIESKDAIETNQRSLTRIAELPPVEIRSPENLLEFANLKGQTTQTIKEELRQLEDRYAVLYMKEIRHEIDSLRIPFQPCQQRF